MNKMRMFSWFSVPAALVLFTGCATTYKPAKVDQMLYESLASARTQANAGRMLEARQLASAVEMIDPDYPGLQELNLGMDDSAGQLYSRPMLGSNKAVRYSENRSIAGRIGYYLPDRILDMLDVVSADAHVGPGCLLNVHATRAVQAGAGVRAVLGFGWHSQRNLGFQYQTEGGLVILPYGAQGHSIGAAGTSGVRSSTGHVAGTHLPSTEVYQDYRDYWAFGGAASLLAVGMDVDFHPVQVVDFLTGWVGVDFLNDDFSHTKGVKLSRSEEEVLTGLNAVARSEESMALYQEYSRKKAVQ